MVRINSITIIVLISCLGLAQDPHDQALNQQVEIAETLGTGIYHMITEPTPEKYNALQEGIYQEALVPLGLAIFRYGAILFPDDPKIKENLKKFEDRKIYLMERYQSFYHTYKETGKPEVIGSMAVIQFHLGQKRASIEFLSNYLEQKPDRNLVGLLSSLYQEARLKSEAAQVIRTRFDDFVESGEKDQLLQVACQWYVFACYDEISMSLFEGLAFEKTISDEFLKEIEFLRNTKEIANQNNFLGKIDVE